MSISAMIPICEEIDGWWICTSRSLCSHGFGTVTGTGPGGRIVQLDVDAALSGNPAAEAVAQRDSVGLWGVCES